MLHAFEFQSATNLKHWLSVCPRRQITVLDTHDGMGIDDITGLANVRRRLLAHLLQRCLPRIVRVMTDVRVLTSSCGL